MRFIHSIFIGLMMGLVSFNSLAETVYVSSLKAKLLIEPSFKAASITTLNKGTELEIVQKKRNWYQVKTPEQQGWLLKFAVKPTPPNNRISVLPSDEETQLKDVRRRTSTITTAAAARGLAAVSTDSGNDPYKSDMKAVEWMESFVIPSRALQAFAIDIRQGEAE